MSRVQASGTGGAGGGSGTGSVTGIPPTTINNIVVWANGIATYIKNSLASVQPAGDVHAQGFITNRNVTGTMTVNATETWIAPGLVLQPGSNVTIQPGGELIII
jgi:hypothetical protein